MHIKCNREERSAEIPKEVDEIGGLSRIRWPFNACKRLSGACDSQRQVTGVVHAKSAANDSFVLPADSIFVHFPPSIDLLTLVRSIEHPLARKIHERVRFSKSRTLANSMGISLPARGLRLS